MNKVAKELLSMARGLVSGQMDRELFNLYSKYERKPYFMYNFSIEDGMGNMSLLWARFYIRHAEHLVVEYNLVGSQGTPYALENLGMKKLLPKVEVKIDDDLERELLASKSTSQRKRVIESVIGRNFVREVTSSVESGYSDVIGIPREESF